MHAVCPETSTYASTCSISVAVGWHSHYIGHRAKETNPGEARPGSGREPDSPITDGCPSPSTPVSLLQLRMYSTQLTEVRVLAIYLYASTTWGALYINTLGPHGSVRARRVSRDATSARAAGAIS